MPARSHLWPDPRVKPPYGAAEIDWSHSLAPALQFFAPVFAGGAVDLVRQLRAAQVGGIALAQATDDGPAVVTPGTSGLYASFSGTGAWATFPVTLLCRGRLVSVTPNYAPACSNQDALANNGVGLFPRYGGTSTLHLVEFGVAGVNSTLSVTTNDATRTWAVAAGPAGSNNTICLVGRQTATVSATSNPINTSVDRVTMGFASAGEQFPGSVSLGVIWSRKLTLNELLWMEAEPYVLLRPLVRRRYSVPAAAGTIIPLIMHHRDMLR